MTIRLAVVGDSRASWPLLRQIIAQPNVTFVAFALAQQTFDALSPIAAEVREVADWTELIASSLDVVVVSAADDAALASAKQLGSAGKSLLVCPVAGVSATFAY